MEPRRRSRTDSNLFLHNASTISLESSYFSTIFVPPIEYDSRGATLPAMADVVSASPKPPTGPDSNAVDLSVEFDNLVAGATRARELFVSDAQACLDQLTAINVGVARLIVAAVERARTTPSSGAVFGTIAEVSVSPLATTFLPPSLSLGSTVVDVSINAPPSMYRVDFPLSPLLDGVTATTLLGTPEHLFPENREGRADAEHPHAQTGTLPSHSPPTAPPLALLGGGQVSSPPHQLAEAMYVAYQRELETMAPSSWSTLSILIRLDRGDDITGGPWVGRHDPSTGVPFSILLDKTRKLSGESPTSEQLLTTIAELRNLGLAEGGTNASENVRPAFLGRSLFVQCGEIPYATRELTAKNGEWKQRWVSSGLPMILDGALAQIPPPLQTALLAVGTALNRGGYGDSVPHNQLPDFDRMDGPYHRCLDFGLLDLSTNFSRSSSLLGEHSGLRLSAAGSRIEAVLRILADHAE